MKEIADEIKRGPVQANFKRYNHTNRPKLGVFWGVSEAYIFCVSQIKYGRPPAIFCYNQFTIIQEKGDGFMPLRLYHHAGGMYREDGKVVCQKCGAELDDNLLSADPCLIQSTSVIYHDGLYWFINVSGLHAELCIAKNIIGQTQYLKIRCADKATAKKLHDLVLRSVEEEGAINISGLYSVSDELFNFIENNRDKIIFEE